MENEKRMVNGRPSRKEPANQTTPYYDFHIFLFFFVWGEFFFSSPGEEGIGREKQKKTREEEKKNITILPTTTHPH